MFFIVLLYIALPLWLLSSKNVKKVRKKKKEVEDTTFSIEKVPKIDIIIIGSNVSGLACAAALSKAGHKVLVLEKEHNIGGSFVYVEKGGCVFETSYQNVGSLIRTKPLVDWLTEKQIWWSRVSNENDVFLSIDNRHFYNSFYTTRKNIKNKKLWYHLREYEQCEKTLFEKINDLYIPERLCCILQDIFCSNYLKYKNTSVIDFLNYFCEIKDEKEQEQMIAFIGTGPIDILKKIDCTTLLDKMLQYKHGAYYNLTGSKGIIEELKHTIQYHGSTILTNANVTKIKKEGIVVVNGHHLSAKYIVSSLPYYKTYDLTPHIEKNSEVQSIYNKFYGLYKLHELQTSNVNDEMFVQNGNVIRCSLNKKDNNKTFTFEMVTKDEIDKEKISKTFMDMLKLKDYKIDWGDIKTTTLPLVHHEKNLRPYTSDKQIYVCGKDIVHTKGLLGRLESGYKTANVLCGYGTLIDIVTSRELMYDI